MSEVTINGKRVRCTREQIIEMDARVTAGKATTREEAAPAVLGLKTSTKAPKKAAKKAASRGGSSTEE